jgi:hypothetical protein
MGKPPEPRSGPGEAGVRETPIAPDNDGLRAVVDGHLPYDGPGSR